MNILCDHVLSIQAKLTHVQPLNMMTESVEKFLVSICNISTFETIDWANKRGYKNFVSVAL